VPPVGHHADSYVVPSAVVGLGASATIASGSAARASRRPRRLRRRASQPAACSCPSPTRVGRGVRSSLRVGARLARGIPELLGSRLGWICTNRGNWFGVPRNPTAPERPRPADLSRQHEPVVMTRPVIVPSGGHGRRPHGIVTQSSSSLMSETDRREPKRPARQGRRDGTLPGSQALEQRPVLRHLGVDQHARRRGAGVRVDGPTAVGGVPSVRRAAS
jgi:hypothetical protein